MSRATAETDKRRGQIRTETGAKRVRAYLGGEVVADTARPVLVWEVPYYPAYYFPLALRYPESPIEELRDLIRLDWDAMDAWFEEDEQVFTHPRDPYTRVDILPSSRHVRVEVDRMTVAESASPRLLFETRLPPRYYLPKTHARLDLLIPNDTVSHCPYKGQAEWWSVGVGEHTYEESGLVVRDAATGEPEDRRADRLLQREGRHLPRRRTARTANHQVLLMPPALQHSL